MESAIELIKHGDETDLLEFYEKAHAFSSIGAIVLLNFFVHLWSSYLGQFKFNYSS